MNFIGRLACEQAHLGARTGVTRATPRLIATLATRACPKVYSRVPQGDLMAPLPVLSLRSPLARTSRYIRACPKASLLAGY